MDSSDLLFLVDVIKDCFHLRGNWWVHKDNDGKLVEVSEDLNEALHELAEILEAADE